MGSLNRRIWLYLLALWGGLVAIGAIGYVQLKTVERTSNDLIDGVYPSAAAALEVETAIHEAYKNTFVYCTYLDLGAKSETNKALDRAQTALQNYFAVSQNTSPQTFSRLESLIEDARSHASDCLAMTDNGMTPAEFQTHIPELSQIQLEAVLALREAAALEQSQMLKGTQEIEQSVATGLRIFLGGTLLLLAVTLGIGVRLSNDVLPPLAALTDAARRFSAQDLSIQVEEKFCGEFDILSNAFNAMADRIRSALNENTHLLQNVRESREKFRDLYDNAPDGYHSLAIDGTILEINNTELTWLQYSRKEIIGVKKLSDLIAESSLPAYRRAFNKLKRTGLIEDIELEFQREDGTTYFGRVNSTAFYDRAGILRHTRCSVRDITNERELQNQLVQSQKLESLGTLSGGIAHDFNNLLTSMMGFSQLAMLNIAPNSQEYQNLDRVVKLGAQAAGLTRQLLTFSRQTPMEKNVVSLTPLTKETIKVLERTLPETIQIYTQLNRDISNIEADATQLQQVLMNLCVNARDAMPDGGTLTISLENITLDHEITQRYGMDTPGDYVRLSVKDTGTGIPPHIQKRIFEPFFTTKEVGKGTGLGLSIVHGIVKSHGGHISLNTEPGTGTEFEVFLPAIEEEETTTEHVTIQASGNETLLLVEDDTNVLEIAQKMLENQGYKVITASDGTEGLKYYHQNKNEIDLIISDIVMPQLSGLDMCREIAAVNPNARVLLISGYNTTENLQDIGVVVGFLPKPFELSRLGTEVRNALDKTPQAA